MSAKLRFHVARYDHDKDSFLVRTKRLVPRITAKG